MDAVARHSCRRRAMAALAGIVSALALLGGQATEPARAVAPDRSTYVPAGLTQAAATAHFVVHYNPGTPSPVAGMTIGQYAQAGAADFEEAYGRDVAGGGLEPNAALRVPTADDDGKTDVYLSAPLNNPSYRGGVVYGDVSPWASSYVFMTPDLDRKGFRFRAGHEFMHVIQDAYAFRFATGLSEGFANWAAEWALPDVDPLDSNFYGMDNPGAPHPWLPLDCYDSWEGGPCGNGYWQWLFIQAQVEDFGPSFVSGYHERFAATFDSNVASLLESEIAAQSGGAQTLRTRFAAYAGDVWDPTRWTTRAIDRLRDELHRQPAAEKYNGETEDTGVRQLSVDHLAVRYVRISNVVYFEREAPGPGSQVVLSWSRPAGMAAPVTPLIKYAGQAAWQDAGSFSGSDGTTQLPFGPEVEDIVLPLVNDSLTADDQAFAYRVQILDGPDTTPPSTRLLRHPRKRTAEHTAVFGFRANEPARYECKLDRRRFKPCGKSGIKYRVRHGRHTFKVRAIDLAGNVDRTAARWRWVVTRHSARTARKERG